MTNSEQMVSVVIPTRNRPVAVAAAVRSVLQQTHASREIIVVIDGPDEQTVEALTGLGIDALRLVQLQTASNDAGASARNAGVAAAEGDWVAFLDDDDEWLPEKLSRHLSHQLAQKDPDHTVSATGVLYRTGEAQYRWPTRPIAVDERIGHYLFVRREAGEGLMPTSAILAPRSLALAHPMREGLKQHVDYDWLLDLETHGTQFSISPDHLVVMNAGDERTSVSTTSSWQRSLAWAQSRRTELGEEAFSAFCLGDVARKARGHGVRGQLAVFRSAISGAPHLRDLLGFAARVWMPAALRSTWRARQSAGKVSATP